MDSVFAEIALLVLLSAGLGFLAVFAGQPLVIPYIAVGVLAGPDVLSLMTANELIGTLSEISIAVLLFLVGLKLDVSLVRNLGRVAVVTGLGQIAATAILGGLICILLGLDWVTTAYIAVALTFSSTIIVVKLLSDKQEIDALHGKIALGILIVQDILVVLCMVALSAIGMGGAEDGSGAGGVVWLFVGGAMMLAFVFVVIRHLADPVLRLAVRSPELMVIFAVGWAAGFAAAAEAIGFGKELGGLLAGVSLASTQYREAIGSRLAALRDFLLLFFFIHLGATLDIDGLGGQIVPALMLSAFVLVAKPVIVMTIVGAMGYRKRTGLLAGLTVAQISEFSLILAAMGVSLGHLGDDALGLVTLVGLVTIALSAYMISWSHKIYLLLEPYLGLFERRQVFREEAQDGADGGAHDFVIFGLGRYGCQIGQALAKAGYRVLGIDFDPAALAHWRGLGLTGHFGDATDPEFAAHLPLSQVRAVISAVPRNRGPLSEADPQMALLHGLRSAGFVGRVALTVNRAYEGAPYLAQGADVILTPFDDAASHAVERILA